MSLEVLLIPIGIAAYSALREARSHDLCEKCKATRITDADLLTEALQSLGAEVTSQTDDSVRAVSSAGNLTFERVGGIFLGRVDDAAGTQTQDMLAQLDSAVGKIVQNRTAERAMAEAEALGFRLIQQTETNGTLNYVFEEI